MKRTGLLLLAFFVFFFHASAWAASDSGVRFADLFGEVSIRPEAEDDDAYEFAELATVLNNDDRIRTRSQSGAILSFADLSTFVMKEESIIVLDLASQKNSKINLIAGNIWVNVKKMVSDGSMDIEMSQAVAGIKGTNITCSTSRGEDRIQVLRGMAEILIRETRETVIVNEGEELIVRAGGKTEKVEIDVNNEQKKWEDATSRLGSNIDFGEIPNILKEILTAETAAFGRINEAFTRLIALEKVSEEDAAAIKKDAERFIGVLLEDGLILASIRKKIDTAIDSSETSAGDRQKFAGLLREVAAVQARQQSYQARITQIMRYQFKLSALKNEIGPEIETLKNEIGPEIEILRTGLAQSLESITSIRSALTTNPNGMSQDWFKESIAQCNQTLSELQQLALKTSELLSREPRNVELQAMVRHINSHMSNISTLLRSLAVVEIDSAKIIEMQQIDDVLSTQMVVLRSEISAYGSLAGTTISDKERRLKSSVQIMSSYSRIRRLYVNAQRLHASTMRAASSSRFKTSEMEELERQWERIRNTFQQLGIAAQELESNLKDLESQLSTYLK